MISALIINNKIANEGQKENMIIPPNVYVTLGGGLGDVFYVYLRGENGWGYLRSLKEKFPFINVRALCSTHNPQTIEFIKHNPYIDEYKEFGWVNDAKPLWEKNSNGAVRLDRQHKLLKTIKFERPKVYLTKEDKTVTEKIISAGRFILMHPFAGENNRIAMPIDEWKELIDQIIDKLSLNVVVIGSSYKRTNIKHKEDKQEEFDYTRDGLFNLVGNSNARICIKLAKEQQQFVGNWSAYSCASWVQNKKTTVVIPKQLSSSLDKKMGPGKRWHNIDCRIVKTNGPSHNPRNTKFDNVRDQIITSIRNGI